MEKRVKIEIDKHSIYLIPNLLTFVFPIASLLIIAFLLAKLDTITQNQNILPAVVAFLISLLGLIPISISPYKLIAEKRDLIFIKPFGRILRLKKTDAKSIENIWNKSGLSYKPLFGKNLHNNKEVIKFIKKYSKNV